MPKLSADVSLFGLDLRQVGIHFKLVVGQLMQWPLVQRWLPTTKGQWLTADGQVQYATVALDHFLAHQPLIGIDETGIESAKQEEKEPSVGFHALCIPESHVLEREFQMAPMPMQLLERAIELQVQTHSPFSIDETLWAYRVLHVEENSTSQGVHVLLVMASRGGVNQSLQHLALGEKAEVWLSSKRGPIMLRGFAERLRIHNEQRKLLVWGAGAGLVLGLMLAIVATPTVQLRQQALDATRQFELLNVKTQAQQAQRQALLQGGQELAALKPILEARIDHSAVIQALTDILPDDTALENINIKAGQLQLRGLSDDASQIVKRLSEAGGFQEVRMPSAVTRMQLIGKESFVVESKLDPHIFGAYRDIEKDGQMESRETIFSGGSNP